MFAYHPEGDIVTGMSLDRPYLEEARESLGLLNGVLAMLQPVLASRPKAQLSAWQTFSGQRNIGHVFAVRWPMR